MEQLLKYTNIPIEIEVQITRAKIERDREKERELSKPTASVRRDNDEFQIKADPLSVNVDGGVLGYASPKGQNANNENYQNGGYDNLKFSYQGIAKVAGTEGADSGDQTVEQATRSIRNIVDMLPKENSNVSWNNGKLNVNYTTNEKLSMDNSVSGVNPKFKFTPGSIEFIVKQLPRVEIEYIGDPLYFPASSDPNYEE